MTTYTVFSVVNVFLSYLNSLSTDKMQCACIFQKQHPRQVTATVPWSSFTKKVMFHGGQLTCGLHPSLLVMDASELFNNYQ